MTDTKKIGINGMGRIGKLSLWHHAGRKFFNEIVINIGRQSGHSIEDIAHYIERDSSYGRLEAYLHGHQAQPVIHDLDERTGTLMVDETRVKILRKNRNPRNIGWREEGVKLVLDTTGRFLDPTLPRDHEAGSVRGHLEAGAEKVICSAPFKLGKGEEMPGDVVTTVMGINQDDYDPRQHRIISNASCTTTCLAHMMKPLLDYLGPDRILSASMATIHAATGSQQVLDRLPKKGATDLRKSRSIMNNIILTSTGAAKALGLVIPEMSSIGFIAESVRVPTSTGSLIILVINFQDEPGNDPINRNLINGIYKKIMADRNDGYLLFTEKQNVSEDIIGTPRAAAVIEGHETHTRTAEVSINLGSLQGLEPSLLRQLKETTARIPVTNAVIYGWYDNELGSYTNMLGDRTVSVAKSM